MTGQRVAARELTAETTGSVIGDHIDINVTLRPDLRFRDGRTLTANGTIDHVHRVGTAISIRVDGKLVAVPDWAAITLTRKAGRKPIVTKPKRTFTPKAAAPKDSETYVSMVSPTLIDLEYGTILDLPVSELGDELLGHELTISSPVVVIGSLEGVTAGVPFDGYTNLLINGHSYIVPDSKTVSVRIIRRPEIYRQTVAA